MRTLQGINKRISRAPVAAEYLSSQPPKPISTLDASMAQLEVTVAEVQKAIEHITDRLSPVLKPFGTETVGDQGSGSDTSQQSAPLVAGIEHQTFRLRKALIELHDLNSRLAL